MRDGRDVRGSAFAGPEASLRWKRSGGHEGRPMPIAQSITRFLPFGDRTARLITSPGEDAARCAVAEDLTQEALLAALSIAGDGVPERPVPG